MELEEFSTDALQRVLELVNKTKRASNKNLKYLGIIPNKVHTINHGIPVRIIERNTLKRLQEVLGEKSIYPAICNFESIRKLQSSESNKIKLLTDDVAVFQQLTQLTDRILETL